MAKKLSFDPAKLRKQTDRKNELFIFSHVFFLQVKRNI